MTATNADIGSKSTIKISTASSSFTHTLTYNFGSLSGTIATKTSNTTVEFTVPTTFYAQIPNAPSGTVTITCITYSGSTEVGRNPTTFIATANKDACRPTVTATLVDVNSTTTALTGSSSKLVKYKSTARITPTITVKNSASIKSIVIKTEIGSYDMKSASYLDIENVLSETFQVIVTDTRGYDNTEYILKPEVIQYIQLTVSATFKRLSETSDQVTLSYSGNFFNGSFGSATNALSLSWKWKEKKATDWEDGGTLTPKLKDNTFYNTVTLETTQSFDYHKSYDFVLYVSDLLTKNLFVQQLVGIGTPIYDYGFDKNGEMYFNSNGPYYQEGVSLFDYIYPVGSIYLTMNEENPSTRLGGTWKQIAQGRTLIGAGNDIEANNTNWAGELNNDSYSFWAGEMGGQFRHKLTVDELASHYHTGLDWQGGIPFIYTGDNSGSDEVFDLAGSGIYRYYNYNYSHTKKFTTGSVGGSQTHNIMQPYLAVYIWQRTA